MDTKMQKDALYKAITDIKEDNWKHRSAKMSCSTCMWFVEKKSSRNVEPETGFTTSPLFGRCRKHAPTLNGWPAIFGTDWCGDHKLDENKL